VPTGPEFCCAEVSCPTEPVSLGVPLSWMQQRWTEHWVEVGEPLECIPWALWTWAAWAAEVPVCWSHPGIDPQVDALSAKHAARIAASTERGTVFMQSMLLRSWVGASRDHLAEGSPSADEPLKIRSR
jgi:hypothetical protein